jgi:hypothetical protein
LRDVATIGCGCVVDGIIVAALANLKTQGRAASFITFLTALIRDPIAWIIRIVGSVMLYYIRRVGEQLTVVGILATRSELGGITSAINLNHLGKTENVSIDVPWIGFISSARYSQQLPVVTIFTNLNQLIILLSVTIFSEGGLILLVRDFHPF